MFKLKYTLPAIFLLAGAAIYFFGSQPEEKVVRVDMSIREEVRVPEPRPAITYAYLPQYSHRVSYLRHSKLIDYLSRESGFTIRQVFPDTFEEHRRMVKDGEIDISFSNPMTYVSIAQNGARAFARIIEPSGSPTFRGQIITRKDNRAITRLKDCIGKTWIAVDPLSAGGYLFPLGLFLKNGIKESDFKEISFAPGPGGKQEKAVLAVYAGKYDFASIREGTLNVVRDKINIDKIRIVAETEPFPGWVYAARKGLSEKVVDKIKYCMFRMSMDNPEQAAILYQAGMRGIIPAQDSDYDSVRTLTEELGLNIDYGQ
ncbi:phosphate/phosphite/phosphonate ABC transporter substrate-binding protein [Maridesulfovibrio salexigens]|uniref:Phosphonate ABC transporter, periplasmic phosphonate-binding protein n=1 Tax=Maridesulfovibrio salexigens (strain ATCC 14822 / DSM 2638 / NCIMB 8403 / VKM B-1763) TaxID=526222 RepID=C6BXC3_MARSD|nr:phosphate/phosphite/phosphonate ABC transporter substrate-binding protein [Maridesulfovibrio salexigens]ACS80429.1 phosphonate ABC transporter, periplasmic phosphonate-binding protein [Maridesulfovibrio salexigens DSM 2638]